MDCAKEEEMTDWTSVLDAKPIKRWRGNNGIEYALVFFAHFGSGHYCGYACFPKRPVIEQGYGGILTYVPVHGGITFAEETCDGHMVYGFDCMHADDELNELTRDEVWLTAETERMAIGIQYAAQYEKRYLLARDSTERAKILDEYHDKLAQTEGIEFDVRDNFGALLNLLCGQL